MKALVKSRKFWMAVLDMVVSLGLYFAGKYALPEISTDINVVVVGIQPVLILIIVNYTIEDAIIRAHTYMPPK